MSSQETPRNKWVQSGLPTPQNLDEAVMHAVCIGPMNEIPERAFHVMKDYIAQRFSVAYMRAAENPEALKILEETFERLVLRGPVRKP